MDQLQNPASAPMATTVKVVVADPSEEARRVVGTVICRAMEDSRHERAVFETPGVLEALDEALDEVAALKRSM